MAAAAAAEPDVEFKPFLRIKLRENDDPTDYTDMSELFSQFKSELGVFKNSKVQDAERIGTCIDLFVDYFFRQTQVRIVREDISILENIANQFNILLQAIITENINEIERLIGFIPALILINVGNKKLFSSPYTSMEDYQSNLNLLLTECVKTEKNKDAAVGMYPRLQSQDVQPVSVHMPSGPILPNVVSHFGQPLDEITDRSFVLVNVPRKRTPLQSLTKNLSTVGNVLKDTVSSWWFSKKGMRTHRNKKHKKRSMRTKRRVRK